MSLRPARGSRPHGRTRRPELGGAQPRRVGRLTVIGAVVAVVCLLGGALAVVLMTSDDTKTAQSAEPYGIWADNLAPQAKVAPDRSAVTLGVSFSARRDGWVTGIQFYRDAANAGPHRASLWSADGTRLSTVEFPSTKATGWLTAPLATPVRIRPFQRYVASYTAPHGGYVADENILSPESTVTHRDLTAFAGVFTYGSGMPSQVFRHSNYYVDVAFLPGSQPPTPTSTSTLSSTPAPTPAPTRVPSDFPDASDTGVPAGTVLTRYTGPCTITRAGTVIDGRRVACSLRIEAGGVTIRNSVVNGTVANAEDSQGMNFTIVDSLVNVGNEPGTGIGAADFTAVRVHVTGGNRSINCWRHCTVRDSFVHGQFDDQSGVAHESGIRMGSGSTIVGNTILCDARDVPPDAGCSADLTGYGDFGPVQDNLIQGNLFRATTGGTCSYGGSSSGKPYAADARDIRFLDNVFERGPGGKCGSYAPIMDFDPSAPGNQWSGNRWDDGRPVPGG